MLSSHLEKSVGPHTNGPQLVCEKRGLASWCFGVILEQVIVEKNCVENLVNSWSYHFFDRCKPRISMNDVVNEGAS